MVFLSRDTKKSDRSNRWSHSIQRDDQHLISRGWGAGRGAKHSHRTKVKVMGVGEQSDRANTARTTWRGNGQASLLALPLTPGITSVAHHSSSPSTSRPVACTSAVWLTRILTAAEAIAPTICRASKSSALKSKPRRATALDRSRRHRKASRACESGGIGCQLHET